MLRNDWPYWGLDPTPNFLAKWAILYIVYIYCAQSLLDVVQCASKVGVLHVNCRNFWLAYFMLFYDIFGTDDSLMPLVLVNG